MIDEYELKNALFDMVGQFAYSGTRGKSEILWDGGLSALENAFCVLGYYKGYVFKKKFYKDWAKYEKEIAE